MKVLLHDSTCSSVQRIAAALVMTGEMNPDLVHTVVEPSTEQRLWADVIVTYLHGDIGWRIEAGDRKAFVCTRVQGFTAGTPGIALTSPMDGYYLAADAEPDDELDAKQAELFIQAAAFRALLVQVASNEPRRLYAVATEPHYLDHCVAVMLTLPPEFRGCLITTDKELQLRGIQQGVPTLYLEKLNLAEIMPKLNLFGSSDLALILAPGPKDFDAVLPFPRVIRIEHGAGQTYTDRNASYAGGPKHASAYSFFVPGPHPHAVSKKFHPNLPVAEIGSPKLDPYVWLPNKRSGSKVITFSFHWAESTEVPERRSAFSHWKSTLVSLIPQLRKDGWEIWGHGHPRAWKKLMSFWTGLGVQPVQDFSYVLSYSDVYVCDNSSSLFEFAALGKPSLFLNAPWYRRYYSPGLRFWDALDNGLVVDTLEGLPRAIEAALGWRFTPLPAIAKVFTGIPGEWSAQTQDALFSCFEQLVTRAARLPEVKVRALRTVTDYRLGGKLKTGEAAWTDRKTADELSRQKLVQEEQRWSAAEQTIPRITPTSLAEIQQDVPWDMERCQLVRYWRIRHGWKGPSSNVTPAGSCEDPESLTTTKPKEESLCPST